MTDIKPASEIAGPTPEDLGLTEAQVRQQRIGKAIRTKRLRERVVATATGTEAESGYGTPDLAGKLERSLAKRRAASTQNVKAKQAVAAALRKKTG